MPDSAAVSDERPQDRGRGIVLLEVTVEKLRPRDAPWLIALSGELDYESAPRFKSAFSCATPPEGEDVMLDLTGLGFFDSSGLATVIELYQRLQGAGARLVVVSSRTAITRLFSMTAVDQFMRVATTREQGIAALAAGPMH
jgi:anti-sigma B factor antagonist